VPVLQIPVTSADHKQGDPQASVTLVEYGDYQCPVCGLAYPLAGGFDRDSAEAWLQKGREVARAVAPGSAICGAGAAAKAASASRTSRSSTARRSLRARSAFHSATAGQCSRV
jgi:protein-disulfide isomerase